MTKTMYSVTASILLVFSISTSGAYAKNSFLSPGAKSTPGIERAQSDVRSFGTTSSKLQRKAKTKVPSSMDLFVDRCSDAGGGLISIDGHYDCVKPSGEPIPDW